MLLEIIITYLLSVCENLLPLEAITYFIKRKLWLRYRSHRPRPHRPVTGECRCRCYCSNTTDSVGGGSRKPLLLRSRSSNKVSRAEGAYVMISYNVKYRQMATWMKNILVDQGLAVWIDTDHIKSGGSTLEVMSRAVEGCSLLLVLVSEGYRNSRNCQAEAEYAFQHGKPIVPLQMEMGYAPDGWLGIILGTKYRYNFTTIGNGEKELYCLMKNITSILSGS